MAALSVSDGQGSGSRAVRVSHTREESLKTSDRIIMIARRLRDPGQKQQKDARRSGVSLRHVDRHAYNCIYVLRFLAEVPSALLDMVALANVSVLGSL